MLFGKKLLTKPLLILNLFAIGLVLYDIYRKLMKKNRVIKKKETKKQKKIKRLIAFSSVSNIGYVLIGFIQENPILLSHSLNYFLIYIINSVGLFLIFLNLYLDKFKFFLERFENFSAVKRNKHISIHSIQVENVNPK